MTNSKGTKRELPDAEKSVNSKRLPSQENGMEEGALLKKIFDLVIKNKLATGKNDQNDKVVDFVAPQDLKVKIYIFMDFF